MQQVPHSGLFDILLNSFFNVLYKHKDSHMCILATLMIYELPARKLSHSYFTGHIYDIFFCGP